MSQQPVLLIPHLTKPNRNYYADCHGIIYVVDTTDTSEDRIAECKSCLEEMLSDDRVASKPILLLANKYDRPKAMDENDVIDSLDLEHLANTHKCPTR